MSCTKHPISNYLTYAKISKHRAFIALTDEVKVPTNIQHALENPKWKEAVLEEMKALVDNQTWDIVEPPKDKKILDCKWIFTVKYNVDGKIDRYKARLVAQGFTNI